MSNDILLTLHAVRLLGFADTQPVAERFSQDQETVEAQLIVAGMHGFVSRNTFGDSSGWSLSELGREENERLLRAELERTDGGATVVEEVHQEFTRPNATVVSACTAVRMNGGDAGRAREDLKQALTSWAPLETRLTSILPRFSGYSRRLDNALSQAASDPSWITATDRDSFHRVWFELHEDLIATLGLRRG
ncbi:hypothetical protein AB0N65_11460 [Paenarthrobacter sp. NPDC089322]|uniref:hypothetical protein n=1 Tax=Paenarthrobacter sp. NPDC089322 TaxID=3155065 RepID=UPI00341A5B89